MVNAVDERGEAKIEQMIPSRRHKRRPRTVGEQAEQSKVAQIDQKDADQGKPAQSIEQRQSVPVRE